MIIRIYRSGHIFIRNVSLSLNLEVFYAGTLWARLNKNFLASHRSMNLEPSQRTDIGTQPLGPTNYTGSDVCGLVYINTKNDEEEIAIND